MKSIINYLLLKNYKFFLVLFLFLSFYFKLDIFKNNFYNFYNDNYFYCCNSFSLKENLSGNIFNILITKKYFFNIFHSLVLFTNLLIPIYFIKIFELFFETKLNKLNSCLFICIFILLPILTNTDIKFQTSLIGFFLIILQFFKKRINFFFSFFSIILLSLYPRIIFSLFLVLINIIIIHFYQKKKINFKFLIILFFILLLVNLNYVIDLYKLLFLNIYQPHLNAKIVYFNYVQNSPYFNVLFNNHFFNNHFFNNHFFNQILILTISLTSFIFFDYDYLTFNFLFSGIVFLIIINSKKSKFYNLLFLFNLIFYSGALIFIYNSSYLNIKLLFNPYTFIFSQFILFLILLFLFFSQLKINQKALYFILIAFVLHNYLKNFYDSKYLTSHCIDDKNCVRHSYKKGGFFLDNKFIKLKDYLEREKIENVFLNKKDIDTKINIENLHFYFPLIFLSNKYNIYNINNLEFKLRDINKKNYILTLVDDNNYININNIHYVSSKNCITYHIIEDLFLCSIK
jgi:hypothetical protein